MSIKSPGIESITHTFKKAKVDSPRLKPFVRAYTFPFRFRDAPKSCCPPAFWTAKDCPSLHFKRDATKWRQFSRFRIMCYSQAEAFSNMWWKENNRFLVRASRSLPFPFRRIKWWKNGTGKPMTRKWKDAITGVCHLPNSGIVATVYPVYRFVNTCVLSKNMLSSPQQPGQAVPVFGV